MSTHFRFLFFTSQIPHSLLWRGNPFVLFLLAIVLSVLLRYTDSDYHFGIFKLFLPIFLICIAVTLILTHTYFILSQRLSIFSFINISNKYLFHVPFLIWNIKIRFKKTLLPLKLFQCEYYCHNHSKLNVKLQPFWLFRFNLNVFNATFNNISVILWRLVL